ncbi:hypothetical protein CUJ84_pRLN2000294 (plasmid) [Rhizobium leguminosarum]|uniref:Uncharacterized protein n=1 Tax=Rhizobium leguminosarum TaxID=384 RepID=A0A2K9ZEG6_RHILE|nr:hypothetical protein CUJ84_pRLN2000096 [Rhizobium leguminosarum]AUW46834.1 hypothetical protein CUJ84_pRLN2000294 [Rhizobium leguminosarum]
MPFSRKGLAGIVAVFPNPFAQHILVDIKITGSLRNGNPTLPDQLHRLKLVLAAEYSSLHSCSPVSGGTP